ncbi:UDP-N-acetylmuramate dehydrogenase [Candidatus Venteria ishoeyi]|uniref:UDP-N-acetylenolpyruvoylglucosamine reductase n=1 Tax=Candidatus Venteria ishoeyi TaxID=1899563 RepID=A0A1H6F8X4_9GAMM|nr:UDP-N-acetylmuramate dehydrogenase [Candidatus Venteria ishoeyi]MDM8547010.1 UDP-N-acetylmuramate dehydrogenase [Candidatus Venteria ishoeyi]SEH06572.1 UDP-N-acetylenolpyruvoylglucosamine reductase [Candidatus Venteria ishoeyi]
MKTKLTGIRGTLLYAEPMSKHTTWRIGGPAACFFIPADRSDLITYLKQLSTAEPIFWLGLGSNLLVRDGGIPGSVILTTQLNQINIVNTTDWFIEAGVSCAQIARQSSRAQLGGGTFFAGIPGTLGGALAMNAGAFGGETWPLVLSVETIDRQGVVRCRKPADYQIAYRSVQGFEGEYFLGATLRFQAQNAETARQGAQHIKKLLQQRKNTQPTGLPSCGSVFRNPKPLFAAKLIEQAGLKGLRQGGAEISEKHANFIINTGGACAADMEFLIKKIQQTIAEKYQINLTPEVRCVGISSPCTSLASPPVVDK